MVSKSTTSEVSLADLRLFAKAAELSGLAAAGRALGIPKASATRQLQRLEATLSQRLINRNGRRFALTDEGRALLPNAIRVLRDIDEAVDAIRLRDAPLSGSLRVAAPYTYGRKVIGPKLPSFMTLHPGLAVSLHLSSRHVDILNDEADVAIRIGTPLADSLVARRLSREDFVFCASPTYLASSPPLCAPADIEAHRLLDFRTDSNARHLELLRPGGSTKIAVLPVLRSNEPEVLVEALIQHAGIAVVPSSFVADHLSSGRLVRVLPDWALAPRDVNVLYAPGRGHSAKIRAFIDFLIDAIAENSHSSGDRRGES